MPAARRALPPLAACLAVLVLPAWAGAARAGDAASVAAVRLTDCDRDAASAAFEGDMRAVPGTSRMQMRFSVEAHGDAAAQAGWERVPGPRLDTWVSSLPGRLRYLYSKHVEGLQAGVAYRTVVRFRWRAADGTVLRTAVRRSRACKVPDPRPDLRPLRITVAPGCDPDARRYRVLVANRGRSTAAASAVALAVGAAALPDQPAPPSTPASAPR